MDRAGQPPKGEWAALLIIVWIIESTARELVNDDADDDDPALCALHARGRRRRRRRPSPPIPPLLQSAYIDALSGADARIQGLDGLIFLRFPQCGIVDALAWWMGAALWPIFVARRLGRHSIDDDEAAIVALRIRCHALPGPVMGDEMMRMGKC